MRTFITSLTVSPSQTPRQLWSHHCKPPLSLFSYQLILNLILCFLPLPPPSFALQLHLTLQLPLYLTIFISLLPSSFPPIFLFSTLTSPTFVLPSPLSQIFFPSFTSHLKPPLTSHPPNPIPHLHIREYTTLCGLIQTRRRSLHLS